MPEPQTLAAQVPDGDREPGARWQRWMQRLRMGAAPSPAGVRPKRNLNVLLREWHKRAGLFAFLFLIWLGFSGFLINQSASWGYDTKRVDWDWVMRLYSLHPEPPQVGFRAGNYWLASTSDYTLIDAKPLETPIRELRGFVQGGSADKPLLFVAATESLLLLTPKGERIDELTPPILPVSTIRRIGSVKGHPGSIAVQDLDAFQSLDEGNSWTPVASTAVEWSEAQPLPDGERSRLTPYSRPSVSLEHVLVDAHSGRLFGSFGAWVINFVGIAAMLLAISGIWMMYRTSSARRKRQ
ncbi:PepSY domain-containing protein [Solimonas sp. SE-A11]|uniref:PepSY domain-containing protein n=1 Tax=Solimonas sp. SE-A11 TaxID=3054954 RepID=UPI00259CB101|nr:PepSY domain-containing protein [Solimonas sp. SE-A11]MDM4768744.1 PepSY domain-containing protein [Solimonas sp. SE-A11]